jgi:hypothetical protein
VVSTGDGAEGNQHVRMFESSYRANIVRDFPTIPTGQDFSLQYQIRLTSDGSQGSYFKDPGRLMLMEPGSEKRMLRSGVNPNGFFEIDAVDLVRFDGTDANFPSAKSALGQWVKIGYNFRWDDGGTGGTIEAFWEDGRTGQWLQVGTVPFADGNLEMSVNTIKLNGPTAWQADEGVEYDAIFFDTTSLIVSGPGVLLADVNLDGVVNGLDVAPFVDVLLNGSYQVEADMNQDEVVNGLDVGSFVDAVVGDGFEAIPEPNTWVLTGLGTVFLFSLRR